MFESRFDGALQQGEASYNGPDFTGTGASWRSMRAWSNTGARGDPFIVTPALTVLVIDDQVTLARAFALALESVGYMAHIAHTAEDGLRLAQREHPAAIILDLRMPFISGTGFLYRLRALPQHRDTPVMVVTEGPGK
jgi:PleD family two-component response regulator